MNPKPAVFALILAGFVAGCANTDTQSGDVNDPLEPANRAIHGVNTVLDGAILRPASVVYGAVTPDPVEDMVMRGADNLGEPGRAINHVLQGQPGSAVKSVARFAVNSTIGLVGLFDPAAEMGLPQQDTDFGATMARWGVGEGPYLVLPALGPSTTRDALGTAVDIALDPTRLLVPQPERTYVTAAGLVDQRKRLAPVIDPIFENSADPYAALRIGYLQNRRRALKGEIDEDDIEDPFAFE